MKIQKVMEVTFDHDEIDLLLKIIQLGLSAGCSENTIAPEEHEELKRWKNDIERGYYSE